MEDTGPFSTCIDSEIENVLNCSGENNSSNYVWADKRHSKTSKIKFQKTLSPNSPPMGKEEMSINRSVINARIVAMKTLITLKL